MGTTLTYWQFQDVNQFTLSASGSLVSEDFDVAAFPQCCGSPVDVFTIDSITPPLSPEYPTPSPIDFLGYGPYQTGIGSGPYPNAVATVPAPEPSAWAIALAGIGGILLGSLMRMHRG